VDLGPVVVQNGVALNRVPGVVAVPLVVPPVLLIVELGLLSVEAFVVLGISVGVNPDILADIFVGASFPVHLDLLKLFERLVLPGVKGLLFCPFILLIFWIVLVFVENEAILACKGRFLVLIRTVDKHIEIVGVVARD